MRLAAASMLYFAIVFGAGFALGPIRVVFLEPRLGKPVAVLCEAPVLLVVMVMAARWVPAKTGIPSDFGSLALIGVTALVLQQLADLAVATWLRGLSASEQLWNFATPAGVIYAMLLLLFAAMPLLANQKFRRGGA